MSKKRGTGIKGGIGAAGSTTKRTPRKSKGARMRKGAALKG